MDLDKYKELSGLTVASADETYITATINRMKRTLESMLGFTLTAEEVNDNQYVEIGKTASECPCIDDIDVEDLDDPDAIVYAYRIFNYNKKDKILAIDPCTDVHKVKLVKDGITFLTLDPDDYQLIYKNGIIKYIELCDACYSCVISCDCNQLAVDADWVWDDEDDIPEDLLYIWSDMVTYYTDDKYGVKSETLGSHRYELFEPKLIEEDSKNSAVLKKYAGPNGSLYRAYTV